MPRPPDRRRPRDHHGVVAHLRPPWAAAVTAGPLGAILILAVIGWPGRDYRQGDFFQFYAGGRAVALGADPYDLSWWRDFHLREGSRAATAPPQPPDGPAWTTPYPLWTLIAAVPVALLPFDVAAATWLVLQLACVVAGLALLSRAVLRSAPRRDTVLLLGLAAGFQPAWLLAGNGNITGFLFAAFAASTALAARPTRAGALLGALALKPQSLVVAALAAIAAASPLARRRLVLAGALVVAALVVVSFALRPAWVAGWLRSLTALQRSTGSNATLWTLGRTSGVVELSVIAPVALLAALVVWWRVRRPEPHLAVAAAVPVSIAVAPHGWSYDQLHLLVTVAVGIETLAALSAAGRAAGLVVLAVLVGLVPWAFYLLAFRWGGEGWTALYPVLMFVALAAADRVVRRARPARAPRDAR